MTQAQKGTKQFICSYWKEGEQYSETLDAENWEDAEQKARDLNWRLDGELMATVPVQLGWFVKLICWLRNLLAEIMRGGRSD